MEKIDLIQKRMDELQKRKEAAAKSLQDINSMTFRQKVEYNMQYAGKKLYRFREIVREAFANYVKKNVGVSRAEEVDAMFNEYWELILDEKITRMGEYIEKYYRVQNAK